MTSAELQIPMALSPDGSGVPEEFWLGLVTDHRRLFDALQDGWLRPLSSETGILLGVESYAMEGDTAQEGHPIEIHLKLGLGKLPELDVAAYRGGQWKTRCIRTIESSDAALYWPGVFPTFAIQEVAVTSEEERARLTGMARFASNLVLPEDLVRVVPGPKEAFPPIRSLEAATRLEVPKGEDSIHGAISMAVWAVPRIDPWLDLLTTSLAPDLTPLPELADTVNAPGGGPWIPSLEGSSRTGPPQDCLWWAAVETLSNQSGEGRIAPREVRGANRWCSAPLRRFRQHGQHISVASGYAQHSSGRVHHPTRRLAYIPGGQSHPTGADPDPLRFKTWLQDLPDLPPAVAWTAATLCGLLHGYRSLDALPWRCFSA